MKKISVVAAILMVCLANTIFAAPAFVYSTYLGGANEDRVNALAVDGTGNVYLAGLTVSTGFPGVTGGSAQSTIVAGTDAFVTKIDATGLLVWSTYLGGDGIDIANAVTVDGSGIVYITGSTTSATFPTSGEYSAYQSMNAGGTDVFITAISATGAGLIYSTYLGCPGIDEGNGIAVDSEGNAYITGFTTAGATPFPTTTTFQTIAGGAEDAFVTKFSATGGLLYSTYLGGTTSDIGRAIAIDGSGNAYVTGKATAAFPRVMATAFKTTFEGPSDAFLSKVSSDGATLLYSTYVGGSNDEDAFGIALDGTDPSTLNVYITGYTGSTDFPDSTGFSPTYGARSTAPDAFVFKLNMNLSGHAGGVYVTYLGGDIDDRATAIKIDASGNVYIIGNTTSTDFPMTDPLTGQDTKIGSSMAFVAELGASGELPPVFSTYLGGVTDQEGTGIGLDDTGNIYVAGWTSSLTTFPTAGTGSMPLATVSAGNKDGFLTKISAPSPSQVATPVITPAAGTYTGSVTITMTIATSGATIRYTTNGGGLVDYTGPVTKTSTSTIAAYAVNDGMIDSATATSVFTIQIETPVITPAAGTYTGSVTITMTTATSGATIRYTTNGGGLVDYTGPVTKTSTSTIAAYAVNDGMIDSATATSAFTVVAEILSVTVRDKDDSVHYVSWAIGTSLESTEHIMDDVNCVLVKNDGNIIEDFSVSATGTNWSFGSPVGINICTVMALFNGNTVPVSGDFSVVSDLVSDTPVWATVSAGAGKFEGTESGDNVDFNTGKKIYMYLKTPKFATLSAGETITITIGCRKH